jgi:hypothetical protein
MRCFLDWSIDIMAKGFEQMSNLAWKAVTLLPTCPDTGVSIKWKECIAYGANDTPFMDQE